MATLFPHLPFHPDETPLSFAARLAAFHTGGRVAPFLRDIGVAPKALQAGKEDAVLRLCAIADVEPALLLRNAFQMTARGCYALRGERVGPEFSASPEIRFCPACLAEDDAAGSPGAMRRGRLLWTLSVARRCPVHRLALLRRAGRSGDDARHEIAVQFPERDEALQALIDAAPRCAPTPLQDYAAARLDGRPGPVWLDRQALAAAVRICELLGALLLFGAARAIEDLSDAERDLAETAGFEAASGGEAGIQDALSRVQRAHKGVGPWLTPQKVFGRLYEWAARAREDKSSEDLRRLLRDHILAHFALPPGREVLGETLETRRLHSVSSLAAETGLDLRQLRAALAAEGIAPAHEGQGTEPPFEAEAGRRVAASVTRKIHVCALHKALGCARPLAAQLLDARILNRIYDVGIGCSGRTRKSVDAREVEDLLATLEGLSRPVETPPPGLVPIRKAAEKAKTPAVEIVHLVLGGFLEGVVRLRGVAGVDALLFDPGEVRIAIRDHMPGMSASAAFAELRIPNATGWLLAAHEGDGPVLKSIRITGPNGRHEFPRFDAAELAAFKAKFITVPRIAQAMSVELREVFRLLKRAPVKPAPSKFEVGEDFYCVDDLPDICRQAIAGETAIA